MDNGQPLNQMGIAPREDDFQRPIEQLNEPMEDSAIANASPFLTGENLEAARDRNQNFGASAMNDDVAGIEMNPETEPLGQIVDMEPAAPKPTENTEFFPNKDISFKGDTITGDTIKATEEIKKMDDPSAISDSLSELREKLRDSNPDINKES